MEEKTSNVISTHGLSKIFKDFPALKSLDLDVRQNSIFGFLGPNGAGKTTTIKLMLGLIGPTAGSASIFGMDSVTQSVDIRARIGYLPQEPHFYEYMTARSATQHPSLKRTGAAIGWGMDDSHEIEAWSSGIKLIEEWYFTQDPDLDLLSTGYRLAYKLAGAFKMVQRAHRIVYYQL